jgi:hypothetical protein
MSCLRLVRSGLSGIARPLALGAPGAARTPGSAEKQPAGQAAPARKGDLPAVVIKVQIKCGYWTLPGAEFGHDEMSRSRQGAAIRHRMEYDGGSIALRPLANADLPGIGHLTIGAMASGDR